MLSEMLNIFSDMHSEASLQSMRVTSPIVTYIDISIIRSLSGPSNPFFQQQNSDRVTECKLLKNR